MTNSSLEALFNAASAESAAVLDSTCSVKVDSKEEDEAAVTAYSLLHMQRRRTFASHADKEESSSPSEAATFSWHNKAESATSFFLDGKRDGESMWNEDDGEISVAASVPSSVSDSSSVVSSTSSKESLEESETARTKLSEETLKIDEIETQARTRLEDVLTNTKREEGADSVENEGNLETQLHETITYEHNQIEISVGAEQVASLGAQNHLIETTTEVATEDTAKSLPDLEDVIVSTELLFAQVTNKAEVTVRDILQSLCAEYNCDKFPKEYKNAVRHKLTELITESAEESSNKSESVSDVGEIESESDAEEEEEDGATSEYEENEDKVKTKTRPKRVTSAQKTKAKASAMRIHAEKLRKRRMEELRVRNEELQLHQTKKDEERAELIASKFETDTDELRIKRLDQRCNLLRLLDQKRLAVVQEKEASKPDVEDNATDGKTLDNVIKDVPSLELTDENYEESSDEEMELEIVPDDGPKTETPIKKDPLSLLDQADLASPKGKTAKKLKHHVPTSPGKSMTARATLRTMLLAKQKKMGNMWLARELGYKSEHEHLKDCMQVEERKRKLILMREQERLKENEKKLERERLRALGGVWEEEEEEDDTKLLQDKQTSNSSDSEEEDDEEMELARTIESDEPLPKEYDASQADPSDFPNMLPSDHSLSQVVERTGDDHDASVASSKDLEEYETQRAEKELSKEPERSAVVTQSSEGAVEAFQDAATEDRSDLGNETSAVDIVAEHSDDEQDKGHNSNDGEANDKEKPAKNGPRNSAWQAILQKEAELAKKMKKRKNDLVEEEADEEEEEEVAGLEDFGFKIIKKKNDGDAEEETDDIDEEDLKGVVDDLSDDEGDEEAGEKARKEMEAREEKERHKEIIRRMRDGYDGRRGGIAVGGAGARGMHRFDQLVAADNRDDAKRLGLLNEDELDSENEEEDGESKKVDEEEDEGALLDKMLKDRFLHRSSVELEENFSDDEEDESKEEDQIGDTDDDPEEKEQQRLAKRFRKRARMQRLLERHQHEEEWSQSRLIEEDSNLREQLQKMKNGLSLNRNQSLLSRQSSASNQSVSSSGKNISGGLFGAGLLNTGGSLALALQASRRSKSRTSFRRGESLTSAKNETTSSFQKNVAFSHVVFQTSESQHSMSNSSAASRKRKLAPSFQPEIVKKPVVRSNSSSLWSKAISIGFQKRGK